MKENKNISTSTENDTGKFKSAEELLSAYNALEREFTKRCQLISKLQAALSSRDGSQADGKAHVEVESDKTECSTETADKSTQADEQAQEVVKSEKTPSDAHSEIAAFTKARGEAEKDDFMSLAISHAEELSDVPEVMNVCIEKYKRKIIAAGSVPSPVGMAVIVPARRPKTLADAKVLADSMLDKF